MITKLVTLALMAVFYGCYFAKKVSQRKKGITTNLLGKGKTGFVKWIEEALKLATGILPIVQLLSIAYGGNQVPLWLKITGLAVNMAGVAVFIVSVLQMKDNWRAGVPEKEETSLVTTGIYSVSRNPAFLGFDLMYLGILLSFLNPYLFVATLITVLLFHLQIVNVEEDFLKRTFGEAYLRYQAEVCRYLGRKRGTAQKSFKK